MVSIEQMNAADGRAECGAAGFSRFLASSVVVRGLAGRAMTSIFVRRIDVVVGPVRVGQRVVSA